MREDLGISEKAVQRISEIRQLWLHIVSMEASASIIVIIVL